MQWRRVILHLRCIQNTYMYTMRDVYAQSIVCTACYNFCIYLQEHKNDVLLMIKPDMFIEIKIVTS